MECLREKTRMSIALTEKIEEIVGSFCVGVANTPYHLHRYCGWP